MLAALRKSCGRHKSVGGAVVRHRAAHYVPLAGPPRARGRLPPPPLPRLSDWNRIPFRRIRHSSVFSRRIPLYLPLVPSRRVPPRPSRAAPLEADGKGPRGGAGGGRATHEGTKTAESGGVKK